MFQISKGTIRARNEAQGLLHDRAVVEYHEQNADKILGEAVPAIVARLVPNLSLSDLISDDDEVNDHNMSIENRKVDIESENEDQDSIHDRENNSSCHDHEIEFNDNNQQIVETNLSTSSINGNGKRKQNYQNIIGRFKALGFRRKDARKNLDKVELKLHKIAARGLENRIPSILSEEDLKEYGSTSLNLETLRPFLADMEIRFLNGVQVVTTIHIYHLYKLKVGD